MKELTGEKGQSLDALLVLYARYTREENIAQSAYILNQILFIYGQDERREQAVVLMLKGKTEANIDEHIEHYLPVFERHYSVGRFKHMLAQNLKQFGEAYSRVGAWEKSKKFLLRAKNLFEKIFGSDHFYVSDVYLILSEVCQKQGNEAESLVFLRKGSVLLEACADKTMAEKYRQMYQESYGDTAGVVMARTAVRFYQYGELHQAAVLFKLALGIYENEEKSPYPRCIWIIGNLINIYNELNVFKDLGEVKKLYKVMKKLVAIYECTHQVDTPQMGNLLADMGRICCGWKRYRRAKGYFKRSRAIFEKCGLQKSTEMTELLEDLAWVNNTLASSAGFWKKVPDSTEKKGTTPSKSSEKPLKRHTK